MYATAASPIEAHKFIYYKMIEEQQQTNNMSCCGRLLAEWRLDMWSTTDVNGKFIDMKATFRPQPRLLTGIVKLGFLVWSIQIIASAISDSNIPNFWLAYLTNWGICLTIIYQTLSLTRMVLPVSQDPVDFLTRFTWGMFVCVAVAESIITILYWALEYQGEAVTYANIMKHGILMLTIWFDGFVLNRIPLRFKQVLWPYILSIMYLIWTGIHAATDIGNPTISDNDPETDDDAIYSSLNWNERPASGVIISVVLLIVMNPLLFLFMWYISTLIGRRYIMECNDEGQENGNDVEAPPESPESSGGVDVKQPTKVDAADALVY